MTEHDDNQRLFSRYLDGELSEAERDAFETRLAEDSELEAAFDAYSSAQVPLVALPAPPPVDLRAGVARKIRRRSRGRYFGQRASLRERAQSQVFILLALIVLIGIALIAAPSNLKLLLGEPTFVPIDPEGQPSAPDDGALENESDDGPGPEGPDDENDDESAARTFAPTVAPPPLGGVTARASIPLTRQEFRYTVRSELDEDALERRLSDQFGERVRREGSAFVIAAPRAQVPLHVQRLSDLGTIHRELVEVDPTTATLDIVVEAVR